MTAEEDRVEKTVSSFKKSIKPPVSKDGITVPPAPNIIDSEGTSWSLSHKEDHGGNIILRDGKRMPGTGRDLVWHDGRVYLRNDPGAWFVWVEEAKGWAQASNPFQLLSS